MKGPSAATLYGTDAANGVIVITTKKGQRRQRRAGRGSARAARSRTATTTGRRTRSGDTRRAPATQLRCSAATMHADDVHRRTASRRSTSRRRPASRRSPPVTAISTACRSTAATTRCATSSAATSRTRSGRSRCRTSRQRLDSRHGARLRDEWMHPEALQRQNRPRQPQRDAEPEVRPHRQRPASRSRTAIAASRQQLLLGYQSHDEPRLHRHAGSRLHRHRRARRESARLQRWFTPATIFQVRAPRQDIQRIIGSATANWRPFAWLQNDGTVGIDLADRSDFDLCRFTECPAFGHDRAGHRRRSTTTTTATSRRSSTSNASWKPKTWAEPQDHGRRATTRTSRATSRERERHAAAAGRADRRRRGGDERGATSSRPRSKTLGFYVQEQAALRDRCSSPAAVRTDQNSAFGTNFQRVFYPKVSVSWIMSDEAFFPQFELAQPVPACARAYGASGVQPGATTALRHVHDRRRSAIVEQLDTPGLRANALGNPNLKPETSARVRGRLRDARAQQPRQPRLHVLQQEDEGRADQPPIAPSAAPSATDASCTNLGSVQNTGLEATLNATLIDRRALRLGHDARRHRTTANKVLSLGVDPRRAIRTRRSAPGRTRDSRRLSDERRCSTARTLHRREQRRHHQATEVTVDPDVVYRGYSFPRDLFSIQNGFDLLNRKLRINALFDYKGGYTSLNNTTAVPVPAAPRRARRSDRVDAALAQARAVAKRYGTTSNGTKFTTPCGYCENGQFWRFRELSATLHAAESSSPRLRARDASLMFAARNLHSWTQVHGVDPGVELRHRRRADRLHHAPPPTYFTFRLNLHY